MREQTPSPSGQALSEPRAAGVASALLSMAQALEEQETRIKAVLTEAAATGDLALVRRILDLWQRGPVSDVLAQLGRHEGV
jgi:hypothetical protein